MKRKLENLVIEEEITKIFNKHLKNKIQKFKKIKKLKILKIKKYFHIVNFYKISYFTIDNESKKISLVGYADKNFKQRENYRVLSYIYNHGFNRSPYKVPQPLFYYKKLEAMFYVAEEGPNLYSSIIKNEEKIIEKATIKAAKWLKRFHKRINIKNQKKYKINRATLDPTNVLENPKYIKDDNKNIKDEVLKLLNIMEKEYKKLFSKEILQTVHGDFHPENILLGRNKNKFCIIDFTDCKTSHFTIDIGSFIQQIESMGEKNLSVEFIYKMQKNFLKTYFGFKKDAQNINSLKVNWQQYCKDNHLNEKTIEQIHFFYNWYNLKAIIFFLANNSRRKIKELIGKIKEKQSYKI